MSALGQKQNFMRSERGPLYPQSGHWRMGGHVRFVPQADIDVMREPFDQWAFDVSVRHVHNNVVVR